jgi:hypothetical protein
MPTGRARWFAEVLQAGLDTKLLAEHDILAHVTPAVLAGAMPKSVLVRMFDAALSAGTISPKEVVQTASPELIGEHVAPALVWSCIAAGAERAGIPEDTGERPDDDRGAREFLQRGLASALSTGVLTPKEIVQHVNAKVIGHFPDALTTKLLEVSLAAGKMNPELVVETLGVESIAKHAPTGVLWACFIKASEASTAASASPSPSPSPSPLPAASPSPLPLPAAPASPPIAKPAVPQPTLEFIDDDAASVFVDLEDGDALDRMVLEVKARELEDKAKKAVTKRG